MEYLNGIRDICRKISSSVSEIVSEKACQQTSNTVYFVLKMWPQVSPMFRVQCSLKSI